MPEPQPVPYNPLHLYSEKCTDQHDISKHDNTWQDGQAGYQFLCQNVGFCHKTRYVSKNIVSLTGTIEKLLQMNISGKHIPKVMMYEEFDA